MRDHKEKSSWQWALQFYVYHQSYLCCNTINQWLDLVLRAIKQIHGDLSGLCINIRYQKCHFKMMRLPSLLRRWYSIGIKPMPWFCPYVLRQEDQFFFCWLDKVLYTPTYPGFYEYTQLSGRATMVVFRVRQQVFVRNRCLNIEDFITVYIGISVTTIMPQDSIK